MLVRCGVAGCIMALAMLLLAPLAAVGGDSHAGSPLSPYGFLCLSVVACLAGEALIVIGKSRPSGRSPRIRMSATGLAASPGPASDRMPGVDDLVGMLDDTLKLARAAPVAGELGPANILEVLQAAAAKQRSPRLTLVVKTAPIHTLARPALGRAFEILLQNALAHGAQAQASCDHGTSALVVHVDDDGPGIPRSERTKVFDWRYYMTTPPSQQIGCCADLVIARQIMLAHGGELIVGPSPLGGARFTARLPLLAEHQLELAAAS